MKSFARHFTVDLNRSSILEALRRSPFDRCVYRCSNDVVDHQTVNMEFEGGVTVNLIMHGHSHDNSRTMRYDGTLATLEARFKSDIAIHDHRPGKPMERIVPGGAGGHGGGDRAYWKCLCRRSGGKVPAC